MIDLYTNTDTGPSVGASMFHTVDKLDKLWKQLKITFKL